jgi:hypothetical protein
MVCSPSKNKLSKPAQRASLTIAIKPERGEKNNWTKGFFAAHIFTVRDQERSKDFYVRILGGKVIKPENPCYIKLANTWIILDSGGGPTPDKPEVLLETPSDLDRVNSFLNLRVADI